MEERRMRRKGDMEVGSNDTTRRAPIAGLKFKVCLKVV